MRKEPIRAFRKISFFGQCLETIWLLFILTPVRTVPDKQGICDGFKASFLVMDQTRLIRLIFQQSAQSSVEENCSKVKLNLIDLSPLDGGTGANLPWRKSDEMTKIKIP